MSDAQQPGEITLLRLTSGEEIIAEVTPINAGYLLKNPAQIFLQPDPASGKMSMGLMPFMMYSKDELVATAQSIAIVSYPNKELEDEYKRMFSSIILPKSPKVELV